MGVPVFGAAGCALICWVNVGVPCSRVLGSLEVGFKRAVLSIGDLAAGPDRTLETQGGGNSRSWPRTSATGCARNWNVQPDAGDLLSAIRGFL